MNYWIAKNKTSTRSLLFVLFVLLSILFIPTAVADAQEEGPFADRRFRLYTTEDGLPNNRIQAIHQDQQGFMWFATLEGVARFDGYNFVTYAIGSANDGQRRASNYPVRDLMEDEDGFIWLATVGNGIHRFDPRTQLFDADLNSPDLQRFIGSGIYFAIAQDKEGRIFAGGQPNGGLTVYDPETAALRWFDAANFGRLPIDTLAFDKAGGTWLASRLGLARMIDEGFELYDGALQIGQVSDILTDQQGELWFGADKGLFRYDVDSDRFVVIEGAPRLIQAVTEDLDGVLWVGSASGLYTYDPRKQAWLLFAQHDPLNHEGLPAGRMTDLFIDNGGNVWVGTESGAAVVDPRQARFSNYPLVEESENDPVRGQIGGGLSGRGNEVWFGANNQLIRWLDGEIERFPMPNQDEQITSLYYDSSGLVFVGTGGGGPANLYAFDLATSQFRYYPLVFDEEVLLMGQQPSVSSIIGRGGRFIWVGVVWRGLIKVDIETGEATYWLNESFGPPRPEGDLEAGALPPPPPPPSALEGDGPNSSGDAPGGPISLLSFLPNDDLFVGFLGPGFSQFDLVAEEFEFFFRAPPSTPGPFGRTQGMVAQANGELWLGTRDGLIKINQDRDDVEVYGALDGMASTQVYGLIEDNYGDLWMSTLAGLSRFNVETELFENYGRLSNLPVGQFVHRPPVQLDNGQIVFGYDRGLIVFDPAEIQANPQPPQVVLTEIRLANEPVPVGEGSILSASIEHMESITLGYQDDFVSFEFASLAYAAPEENLYRYRLEGLEEEWNTVGADRRFATYTDLKGGTYVLRVQGSNEDGVWNSEGVALTVVVESPWWEMWWFRLIVLLVAAALLWLAVRLRLSYVEQQQKAVELEQQKRLAVLEERQRIGRELHDDIGQVIGYVSVQSQTALNRLRQNETEPAIDVLQQLIRVAQDAHVDIRQYILGIRDQENATEKLSFLPTLRAYLENVQELYGLQVDLSVPQGWDDKTLFPDETEVQLLRIIQESLNNVRKYAAVDEATILFSDNDGMVWMVVSDKGVGFDVGQGGNNADDLIEEERAHFGLMIMKERAESCDGTFEVRSTLGQGTQVMVRVPKSLDDAPEQAVQGLRVMLVDDHQLYLEGISNLLRTRGVNVVGTASNGVEAEKMAAELQPELILMDVHMPERNGLEATKLIKAQWPDIRVVMLTVSAEESQLYDALRFGASGYLLKSTSGSEFFTMLRDAMRGESVLTPQMATKLLDNFTLEQQVSQPDMVVDVSAVEREETTEPEPIQELAVLTFRQRQVLELVVQGLTNIQIAEQLFIAESTVKRHVSHMLDRLQLKSRYEMAYYYEAHVKGKDEEG